MRNFVFVLALLAGACGGSSEDATFIAYGSSTTSISLAWQPVSGATEYTVERRAGGGSYEPVVTLVPTDAAIESYLDADISAGEYTYRLTAVGTEEAPRESSTETSDDVALQTTDDPAIGAPVIQIVGSAGGTVELPRARAIIPPGALPDGATVTFTPLAPPTEAEFDAAVEIIADEPFTKPVTITFARPDGQTTENLALAVKQANGTWVTEPLTADDAGVSVIMPLSVAARRARPAQPPFNGSRAMMFRRMVVWPDVTYVKQNTKTILHAVLRFSDDPCTNGRGAGFCQLAERVSHLGSGTRYREPVVRDRPIRNADGEWTNLGPGQLFVHPPETVIIHSAPPTKPAASDRSWRVLFTTTYESNVLQDFAVFNYDECLATHVLSSGIQSPADVCTNNWTGTASALFPNDASPMVRFDANVVWTYDIQASTLETSELYPVGSVTLTSLDPCLSYSPSTFQFGAGEKNGSISIDHTVDPPTYYGAAASFWQLTSTNSCTDPPSSGVVTFGGGWFSGSGDLTNPTVMHGPFSLGGTTYTYQFVKDP